MTTATESPEPAQAAEPRPRAPRVHFVDVLRLIASFQMVNGHTLDAVMVDSIRGGDFYDRYIWFRGLVSVSFLVVAGIAFHLSTLCRFERHKADPAAVRRRFRRAGFIVLVGYLLHAPWSGFSADPAQRAASWDAARAVDVLHCIGFTLLILETITLFSRRRAQVIVSSALLAALLILGAPFADSLIADGQARFLLNWVSHQGGSPFPLFPWSGFVFVGLVLGALVFPDAGRTPFAIVMKRLACLTALTWGAWALMAPVDSWFYLPGFHHPATDPRHSIEKLAAVLSFLMMLAVICRPIRKLPGFLSALSQETLTIYALHLVLIYYPGIDLARRFDHALGLPAALACSAGMMVATLSATYYWHRFKKGRTGRRVVPRKGSSDPN